MAEKPRIVITMGDPCGIGPEIIAKALASGEVHPLCRPLVVGNAWAMEQAVRLVGAELRVRRVDALGAAGGDFHSIDVLDLENLAPTEITTGQVSPPCGRAAHEWREEAARLVASGQADGAAMAPINSEAMELAGVRRPGEGQQAFYLFLMTGPLRVVHFTDHIPLRQVCAEVKKDRIVAVLDLIHTSLERWGVSRPSIGVAGLNPHAVGVEEGEEITPAVEQARERGISAVGPVPPDTVFRQCVEGRYDVVLAMHHDQGHIAVKTYRFMGTASIALGRPYIQTSIAHGTAFDIAGKGVANPSNMLAAIKLAATLASGKGFPRN